MSREGVSMRKVREILRLRIGIGLTTRQVAESCKVSTSTVSEYEKRFREAGMTWPLPELMDDAELERIVRSRLESAREDRPLPEAGYLIEEMRKPHVTLHLLWLEYRERHPDGYGYTQFCHYYREAKEKVDVVLRQVHRAGEKLFTDYAGDTLSIVDPQTGELIPVYIFVAVLGASNHTFAEGVLAMDLPSWTASHVRALEFIGGVPEIVVPDNTKCAVIRPDRYEPDLNREFAEMASHYGFAVIPARVGKPRDKAKVEAGVLVVERWILARLRNRTFHSLAELNKAIRELLDLLNSRKLTGMNATRRELFERLDKPALAPLPQSRYEYAEWRTAKVNIDYHVAVAKHFYSVPYQLVRQQVEVRMTTSTVEILYKNRRIASHMRSYAEGRFTTNPDHMPKSHRRHLEWTPSRIISWADTKGPNMAALVKRIIESKPHPEQGYRSCLGIIRLADLYPLDRMEAASERALACNALSFKSMKSILEKGLDRMPMKAAPQPVSPIHANIRGSDYYRRTLR